MRPWHRIAFTAAALALSTVSLTGQSAHTDDQIENEIESQVASSPALSGQAIGVWTHDGVVTLSGQVKDEATRQAAITTVKKIEGVKSVEDHLRLPGEQGPVLQTGAEAAAEAQDAQASAPANEQPAPGDNAPAPAQPPAQSPNSAPAEDRADSYPPPPPRRYPAPPRRAYDRYPQQQQPHLQVPDGPVTLPLGTVLNVRVEQGMDTRHTQPGTVFRAVTAQNIFVRGYVAIPRGTTVEGNVVDVQTSGDFKGSPKLTLQLTALSLDNRHYQLQSNIWSRKGPGKGEQTVGNTIGGAAVGAVIGAMAGGGPGAAIGAGIGGVAAAGVTGAVPGRDLLVRPEAVLAFTLAAPLTVQPVSQDELDRLVAEQQDERLNAPRPRYGYPPPRAYPYPPYAYPPYPPPPPPYFYYYRPYYRYW